MLCTQDFQEAAEAYEEAFGSLAQQRDGDDAAAAGAADNHDHVSTTGPLLAGEAAAAAAVAAAAVVGDRQLLSPGSAVLVSALEGGVRRGEKARRPSSLCSRHA